jgi:hypothetical protein
LSDLALPGFFELLRHGSLGSRPFKSGQAPACLESNIEALNQAGATEKVGWNLPYESDGQLESLPIKGRVQNGRQPDNWVVLPADPSEFKLKAL